MNRLKDSYGKPMRLISADRCVRFGEHRGKDSRRTFERRFKAATGDTPLAYLQRVRVEAAKKLLESSLQSFDEVAYRVGYEDSGFFRKLFIKHTGLRPKDYRLKFHRFATSD